MVGWPGGWVVEKMESKLISTQVVVVVEVGVELGNKDIFKKTDNISTDLFQKRWCCVCVWQTIIR